MIARIAAVAIGRNEGARLEACLRSLAGLADVIVYVDSGSTDGSVDAARDLGARIVRLDEETPFTAARARNAGVAALGPERGDLEYVQFVDGDCTVAPGWIEAAAAALDGDRGAAVVCGRRRERRPDRSVYNRLCDMEWNTPVGQTRACGGDSMMRLAAFDAVGGFDPGLIAGEEPELCLRLRRAGWTVQRIDREMTAHDAAITRFGQWVRRMVRSGWAYAEGADRYGDGPERYNVAQRRSIVFWGGLAPAAIAALLAAGGVLAMTGWAVWPLALGATGAAAYPAMALRVARGRRIRFGDPWPHALAYGVFVMAAKFPQLAGVLRYRRSRRAGGPAHIIEYKGAAPS